jgi:hypothetical protein
MLCWFLTQNDDLCLAPVLGIVMLAIISLFVPENRWDDTSGHHPSTLAFDRPV